MILLQAGQVSMAHVRCSECRAAIARQRRIAQHNEPALCLTCLASRPEASRLVREARALRRRKPAEFWANAARYRLPGWMIGFQDRVSLLVGPRSRRRPGRLRTLAAFELAADRACRALAECGEGCTCTRLGVAALAD
jgi:hypothetical protein